MSAALPGVRAGVECWRRDRRPRQRLVCFAHAGAGAAAYQPWPAALPEAIEVYALRLPGREQLVATPCLDRLEAVLDWALGVLTPLLDVPFALFGHSLGALIAFEFARRLRRSGLPMPHALLVSGRRAPHLPPREPPVAAMPDAEFIAHVTRMSGTPPEAFAHPELRALILPALRADFAVLEHYSYAAEPPFALPLHVYGGTEDPLVPPEDLAAWSVHTTGPCTVRVFPGHHFYLQTQRDALLQAVRAALDATARRQPA